MMGFLAAGNTEVFVVNPLNIRIFMRLTQWQMLVGIIYGFGAGSYEVYVVSYRIALIGLTATVYASAGACHDLNHVDPHD